MGQASGHTDSPISAIQRLHRERREALLRREPESYSAFFWDDSLLFIFDHRMAFAQMRRQLPLVAAGSEAITVEFPPLDDFVIG